MASLRSSTASFVATGAGCGGDSGWSFIGVLLSLTLYSNSTEAPCLTHVGREGGLNRLTSFAEVSGPSRSLEDLEAFEYDRWGNLTGIDRASSSKTLVDYLSFAMEDSDSNGVPDDNRMESATTNSSKGRATANLTWDNRGNLTEQTTADPLRHKEYRWFDDDLLQQSVDDPHGSPTIWRYAYDAAGERVVKWRRGASGVDATVYVRDEDGSVISEWEYVAGGSGFDVIREYVSLGGMAVAEIDHGHLIDSMRYVVSDHLGSTRLLFDDSQTTIETMDYYPFGEILTGNQTPETNHLFTGHERDLGTGSSELDYMHARYYSPILARFLSVDPVSGKTELSQSWNRYSYVLGNPVRLVDPNGEDWFEKTVGFLQGVGGALSFGLAESTKPSPNDTPDQREGQIAGALVVQAYGAISIANGTIKMGGGSGMVALAPATTGTSAGPGGVLIAAGAGEAAVGAMLVAGSRIYLSQSSTSGNGEATPGEHAQQRGSELVRKHKAEGAGTAAGRSGGHGTPYKKAGAELIREANKLPKSDPLRSAMKREGKRLIERGRAIDHR